MNSTIKLRGLEISPPLFLAPMAGITHSAFRRLVSDFGGYGALYTELISGLLLIRESEDRSPFLKRRPQEGHVIYQLLITGTDHLAPMVEKLISLEPAGIDVNCGCGARDVRRVGGGTALFNDPPRLEAVLSGIRSRYAGPLSIKMRLGRETPDWRERLTANLRLAEDCGVDFLAVHPRFSDQRLRMSPRHELLPWIVSQTRLPVIASGDIGGARSLAERPERFAPAAGIMVGRSAAAQPWIFSAWNQPDFRPDYLDVWNRFYAYVLEDFRPHRQGMPLKMFLKYFVRNFQFGAILFGAIRFLDTPAEIHSRTTAFLSSSPDIDPIPYVSGL